MHATESCTTAKGGPQIQSEPPSGQSKGGNKGSQCP